MDNKHRPPHIVDQIPQLDIGDAGQRGNFEQILASMTPEKIEEVQALHRKQQDADLAHQQRSADAQLKAQLDLNAAQLQFAKDLVAVAQDAHATDNVSTVKISMGSYTVELN